MWTIFFLNVMYIYEKILLKSQRPSALTMVQSLERVLYFFKIKVKK